MEYFYRNTGGDELLFIHRGAGVIETQFGAARVSRARLRRDPDRDDVPRRCRRRPRACSSTNARARSRSRGGTATSSASSRSTRRITSATSARPVLQAAGRGPGRVRSARHQRRPQRDLHRAESSLRRHRLGRLLLSLRVQHRRVRADHGQAPPAAAGACDVRIAGRRLLRVRAAALRLSSAGHPRAVQPFQRGLRRSALLRQRQLHEPPRRRGRFDHAARGRRAARPAAGRGRSRASGRRRPTRSP